MNSRRTASNLAKQYGSKNRVKLINFVSVKNAENLTVTNTETKIKLLAVTSRVNHNKTDVTNDRRSGFKVLAAIDNDFDGAVKTGCKLEVDGVRLDVVDYQVHYEGDHIVQVVFYTNG